MKKSLMILLSLMLLLGLCGCSGGNKSNPETKEPVAVPEAYRGSYHEEIAGRAYLELGEDHITIDWSSSAYESAHYEFDADYDEENNRINYSNGSLKVIVYETEDKFTESVEYENATGCFEIIDEDRLVWSEDSEDEYGDPVIFVRNDVIEETPAETPSEETPVEATGDFNGRNPWIYTSDLDEAIAYSGIDFYPPIDEALPKGMTLLGFTANINGIISAEYESEDRLLSVRKSSTFSGRILSGDYNNYSRTWTEVFKGMVWDCYGDGETINLAYIDIGGMHYSLSCRNSDLESVEGNGISPDELRSIINGMQ